MTNDEAVAILGSVGNTVQIRKFSAATQIRDCSPELWAMLGLDPQRPTGPEVHGKYLMCGDLEHDVWHCKIGLFSAFGHSFADAVDNANRRRVVGHHGA